MIHKLQSVQFAITLLILATAPGFCSDATKDEKTSAESDWFFLKANEKEPGRFESYLKEHPDDEARRIAALVWYNRREKASEKLRQHTLEMIKYHPDNMHVYFENGSAFYTSPKYKLEVINLLEKQVSTGKSGHGVYWNLALACKHGAIPIADATPEGKARFLRYYCLPPETEIPHEVDRELAEKAVGYFRKAISKSDKDDFHFAFYSEQLADLLTKLGRYAEAVGVCRDALPRAEATSKPNLMVTYGDSLRLSGCLKEAKDVLNGVRRCDKEGFEKGPGHATHDAETILGLIAIDANDLKDAKNHLLASCKVQKCCHNTTKGMRLDLAQRILAAGEAGAVLSYCSAVLHDFTPDQKETLDLLHQAETKQQQ